jgi:hypothetical protein
MSLNHLYSTFQLTQESTNAINSVSLKINKLESNELHANLVDARAQKIFNST